MVLMIAGIAALVAIVLNLIVPRLGKALMGKAPTDPKSFEGKLYEMFDFHVTDPVVSSLVVALLTFLAVLITAFIPLKYKVA